MKVVCYIVPAFRVVMNCPRLPELIFVVVVVVVVVLGYTYCLNENTEEFVL